MLLQSQQKIFLKHPTVRTVTNKVLQAMCQQDHWSFIIKPKIKTIGPVTKMITKQYPDSLHQIQT